MLTIFLLLCETGPYLKCEPQANHKLVIHGSQEVDLGHNVVGGPLLEAGLLVDVLHGVDFLVFFPLHKTNLKFLTAHGKMQI